MNPNIVLGVTGGIAAYKACEIVSRLKKAGVIVDVIMTKNAAEFVKPLSFETLSNNAVVTDTFKRAKTWEVEHISLAKKADLILIAPATANVIGKIANGIADDMLTTTVMASNAVKVICPAMNSGMYNNIFFKENLNKLTDNGYIIIEPLNGLLACGDVGEGKMQEPIVIVEKVLEILQPKQDLSDKKVLITCGGTEEAIDPVRVITNHSSGKMGLEIARECKCRGAEVTLVKGNTSVDIDNDFNIIEVKSTLQMYDAVMSEYGNKDYLIMAAAPSDYRVVNYENNKIKSEKLTLELIKNPDIAKAVGEVKGNRTLVIFSAETSDLTENAVKKLNSKKADLVVANDVTKEGAGFNSDTNIATIINKNGIVRECDIMPKRELAKIIVDCMLNK